MSDKDFKKFRNQIIFTLLISLLTFGGSSFILVQKDTVRIENIEVRTTKIESRLNSKVDCSNYSQDRTFAIEEMSAIRKDISDLKTLLIEIKNK